MARLSADFTDQVHDAASNNLFEQIASVVKFKKTGSNYVALCPFHNEKTPSFYFNTLKNRFRCYGCNEQGDAIDWMMKRTGLNYREAILQLAEHHRIPLPANAEETLQHAEQLAIAKKLNESNALVCKHYIVNLLSNKLAKSYLLHKRKWTPATIAEWMIGFSNTPLLNPETIGLAPGQLEALGLICLDQENERLYNTFSNRLMFPIWSEDGHIAGFAGRKLSDSASGPKYKNNPDTTIFKKSYLLFGLHKAKAHIIKSRTAIAVEGYPDVISLHQCGERNTVAPMGTSITIEQIKRLLQLADTLVFAFDGDKAGTAAAERALMRVLPLIKDGKTAKFAFIPNGQDPDDIVLADPTLAAWHEIIDTALPLSKMIINQLGHIETPEQRSIAAKKACEILGQITSSPIFAAAMKTDISSHLGIPVDLLTIDRRTQRVPAPESSEQKHAAPKEQFQFNVLNTRFYGESSLQDEFDNELPPPATSLQSMPCPSIPSKYRDLFLRSAALLMLRQQPIEPQSEPSLSYLHQWIANCRLNHPELIVIDDDSMKIWEMLASQLSNRQWRSLFEQAYQYASARRALWIKNGNYDSRITEEWQLIQRETTRAKAVLKLQAAA
jgi:DNA primase